MRRAFVLLALAAAACAPRPAEPTRESSAAGPALFVAGEERGYLEPCGCTRPQLGGLARKGAAVGDGTLVENGDIVTAGGRLNEIKAETSLLAFSAAGGRALNVGEGDLALGIDFLRSAADIAGFPLLSANVLDEAGHPAFPAFADYEVADTIWRIVGALDPALAPEFAVADPAGPLAAAIDGAPEGARVIVLWHGTEAGAAAIAKRHPGVEAVVFAHTGGDPIVRSPRLVSPGDKSRFLIRLGPRPTVIELGEDWPDDPKMVRAMKTYVRRITEEDLLHRMNPRATPRGGGYVGDRGCVMCHSRASKVIEASLHAKAIEPLAKTSRETDPDCVGCHVIGYGEETGFLSVEETPALARVGCESCHGPGREHQQSAAASAMVDREISPTVKDARAVCDGCHTPDTDPHFEFEERWRKIRHE